MIDSSQFGRKIKKLRELKDFTKYEMSIQADLQYPYYCNIEAGRQLPSLKGIITIANALDTTIDDLINENEKSPERNILEKNFEKRLNNIKDDNILNEIKCIVELMVLQNVKKEDNL